MMTSASGLEYLHGEGVIHNDIKDRNVLLFNEGSKKVAKFTDFGARWPSFNDVCWLMADDNVFVPLLIFYSTGVSGRGQGKSGVMSHNWVAPEIADEFRRGRPVPHNKEIDVYAFGLVCCVSDHWLPSQCDTLSS
jgi:serine/threonine protein kinase